jgi:hypothetical protein
MTSPSLGKRHLMETLGVLLPASRIGSSVNVVAVLNGLSMLSGVPYVPAGQTKKVVKVCQEMIEI